MSSIGLILEPPPMVQSAWPLCQVWVPASSPEFMKINTYCQAHHHNPGWPEAVDAELISPNEEGPLDASKLTSGTEYEELNLALLEDPVFLSSGFPRGKGYSQ